MQIESLTALTGFSVEPGPFGFMSVFPPVATGVCVYMCVHMCVYPIIPSHQQAKLCDRSNKQCLVQQGIGASKK